MKFAFISIMDAWQWGGSEELWTRTALQLRQRGHSVRASVPYWPELSPKFLALRDSGITLDTHISRHVSRAARALNHLSRATVRQQHRLLRYRPDLVVISQGHNSGGFEWARFCRNHCLPYCIIVHNNSEFWWFGENLPLALDTYRGAIRVYCVSRHNLELLQLQLGEPLPNAEIVRNPCNVPTEHVLPWPDEAGPLKLASVARLEIAAKGQDLLLQTLARREWRNRPVEVSFFGSGPDELALRRLAALLQVQNAFFRGNVSDVQAIWREHHLLVLPSRYEGLPLVLVEAMWCGRPSVVTNVGGNAELCVESQTGFVAPDPSLSSISAALERAWEKRSAWKEMGQAARDFIQSQMPQNPVSVFCSQLENLQRSPSRGYAVPAVSVE
ncbi:MAG TPA: glycosyltransferase family 4 protein [Acidobacteriaceae bacterium]|nr:glycosyltransferase family 4 protein [Acidobacteriaceae bacterium]